MCPPILLYWPVDRLTNEHGEVDVAAARRLAEGDARSVGTHGRLPQLPIDIASQCDDGAGERGCEAGL